MIRLEPSWAHNKFTRRTNWLRAPLRAAGFPTNSRCQICQLSEDDAMDGHFAPQSNRSPFSPSPFCQPHQFLIQVNSNCRQIIENLKDVKGRIKQNQLQLQQTEKMRQSNNFSASSDFQYEKYMNEVGLQLQEMGSSAEKLRELFFQNVEQGVYNAKATVDHLARENLFNWQVGQKRAQYGPKSLQNEVKAELDRLQPTFENFGSELRALKTHCEQLRAEWTQMGVDPGHSVVQRTDEFRKNMDATVKHFIQESCVVARQPPVALIKTRPPKKEAKTIRVVHHSCQPVIRLVGGTDLGYRHSDQASVSCYLISEEQAKRLYVNKEPFTRVVNLQVFGDEGQKGALLHNKAKFELSEGSYVARFVPPVQLVEIYRAPGKANDDLIPQQRYYLCFLVTLLSGAAEKLQFLKLSLPLAALVHPKQLKEHGADAYIFWEHAFSHGNGILTYVPRENSEGILWPQCAEALNLKFMQLLEGQKPDEEAVVQPISERSMNNLAEKLFGFHHDYSDCRMTWEMFFRIPDNRGGVFRDWLYKSADLVEKYLLPQWNKGLIMGFASKDRAEALLLSVQQPTLLVKFSDGQAGCLIISYILPGSSVQHLRLCGKDLDSISFERALSVQELQHVHTVYPDRAVGELLCSGERKGSKQEAEPRDPYARRITFGPCVEGAPPAPPENPQWNEISPPWMAEDTASSIGSPQSQEPFALNRDIVDAIMRDAIEGNSFDGLQVDDDTDVPYQFHIL